MLSEVNQIILIPVACIYVYIFSLSQQVYHFEFVYNYKYISDINVFAEIVYSIIIEQ